MSFLKADLRTKKNSISISNNILKIDSLILSVVGLTLLSNGDNNFNPFFFPDITLIF